MILALDLARQTGWAAGEPCGPFLYGTFKLDAATEPARFLQLGRIVSGLIADHSVRLVALEAPFMGRQMNFATVLALVGYRAATMMAAESKGAAIVVRQPATIRKAFIGQANLKRQQAKAAVVAQCRWRGWDPRTEDEADALALLDYECCRLSSEHMTQAMTGKP